MISDKPQEDRLHGTPALGPEALVAKLEAEVAEKRRALEELRAKATVVVDPDSIAPVPRVGPLACTYQQEGLWFLQQLNPASTVYHLPYALRLRGSLDIAAMTAALTTLVDRHHSLRTRFESRNGVPEQIIDPAPATWALPVLPCTEDDLETWIDAQSNAPFDLRTGPVFRSVIARIAPDDHVLLLVMHHIISDGWSLSVIMTEFVGLYNAAATGATVTLPRLTIQAVDHAAWQRRWLSGQQLQSEIGYWRDQLADVATLEFPTDRPRPAQPTGAGAYFSRRLPDTLGPSLRQLAYSERTSFLTVALAGFLTVMYRYTGQDDLAVGSIFSGRTRTEVEGLVGFLANTLVLRNDLSGNPTFRELIGRCRETVLDATSQQDVPFGILVESLKPERVPGRNPLFQISFTLQAAGTTPADIGLVGLSATDIPIGSDQARFDLAMALAEMPDGGLEINVEYSVELFDVDRIERLADHLSAVLEHALVKPDDRIDDIDLMSTAERHRVLEEWNPAPVERPAAVLHDLVAQRAAEAPDHIAMRFVGAELTYRDLDLRANHLAHLLVGHGVVPGRMVAVFLDRGLYLPVAELGILKAGGAWVALDPQYPADRLEYQISDSHASVVVTTSDLVGRLPDGVATIVLDALVPDGRFDAAPAITVEPEDPAYMIYTSGSTGRPKGVVVSHRAVVNFCVNLRELFRLTPADRVLQLANPTFDVSVSDFFGTLSAGATIIGAPRTTLLDPSLLQTVMRDERVTFGDIPPAMLRLLEPEPLVDLRILFIGMEPFGAELVNRWARPGREFHNGYGPTEVTITCVDYRCPDEPLTGPPPIGRAMANQRAYVLDSHLRLVPVGVAGELYMAGAGLAHGYAGRTDLTAEKFLPDPYSHQPGSRMYATGDLVRWRADGNIEFLGRVDRQVKIRGLRIELGEIEHAINTHPGVRQSVVSVREPGTPEAFLTAYVVTNAGFVLDRDELREYLGERLPQHMIPIATVLMDELPVTASGKIDEARLPAPGPQITRYLAPETDTQIRVAETWRELLGGDSGQIGVGDNFFLLGGSSLQVIQLIARIRDMFHVTLEPRQLFAHPVLGALAAQIDLAAPAGVAEPDLETSEDDEIAALEALLREKRAAKYANDRDRIVPIVRTERLPCSFQQEGLWFLHQLDPSSVVYQLTGALRISGAFDVDVLQRALTTVVKRHESLRTRFAAVDGVPFQMSDPAPASWPLPIVDLADDAALTTWLDDETHIPFDLETGPVFRTSIARLGPTEHVLLIVVHHIVADGWSVAILADEMAKCYDAERSGATADLPALTVQPADHAAWQHRTAVEGELGRQLTYWRERLTGLEEVEFPSDRPRPAQPTGAGILETRRLPTALSTAVRALAQREHTSFLTVLLAGFLIVLHRYTGQEDLAVGSVFGGRTRSELEPLIGYFANVLVLRTDISGDPTFRELVGRCNDTVLDATGRQDLPFGLVVDALKPARIPGRNPLFQISFSLETGAAGNADFALGDARVGFIDTGGAQQSRFDLSVAITDESDGSLSVSTEHSTELFDYGRIERMIGHLVTVLTTATAAPDIRIGSVGLLSPAELDSAVRQWNPAPVAVPVSLLHDFVAEHAQSQPDRAAFRFDGIDLSYRELDRRANRLANVLIEDYGVTTGSIVGMLLERGHDVSVTELAAMKVGAAWLPLDTTHPRNRIVYQVEDASAVVVVTTADLAGLLPETLPRLLLDDPATPGRLDRATDIVAPADIRPDDIAYVMYTSGSTGTPKGVMISHRSAASYARSTAELFGIRADDRVSQVANTGFDVSIFDFYAAYAAGATVVGASRETLADPAALGALLRDERVTVSYVPPALLSGIDPDVPGDLRVLMVAGSACPADLANRWSARPDVTFHNGYGPTEATVTCVDYVCPPGLDAPPPIGMAMVNHRAYVLDAQLRPAPIGVPGQLFIAGTGLARGYLGRPELTADKFLPDPWSSTPGDRMYATGDLVRRREDGNIEFLGRIDRQVKIRGLRIELGEIEHVLAGHPGVRQAVVVVKDPDTDRARLIGYAAVEPGWDVDSDKLREMLIDQLPLYMIPESVQILAALPLTPNGKLDQAALPDPDERPQTEYVAPATDVQRRLAGVWGHLLGIDVARIGVNDRFFQLGGNSLQVTQLIARIRESFGVSLHPRDLFTASSLGQLSGRIVDGGESADAPRISAVVPINPSGTRPPLFFVHAVGGSVAPYVGLADLLGDDQPFYGLEHPGLHGDTPTISVSEIAAGYVDAIRQVAPSGPYQLGGWSLGGAVAVEMGRQLRASGAEVALVAMIDTAEPLDPATPLEPLPDQAQILEWFVGDFSGIAAVEEPELDLDALRRLPEAAQIEMVLDTLESTGIGTAAVRDVLRRRIAVFTSNILALSAHQPDPYSGRLVLLSAADEVADLDVWRAFATGDFDVDVIPGNHFTVLHQEHLAAVAGALSTHLLPSTIQ